MAAWGEECRRTAVASLKDGDWYGSYASTKSWIGYGGGAWILDTWLLYAASALLHGQPRTALHAMDKAMRAWLPHPADRAVLRWVRGQILRIRLKDPKTALDDLRAAVADAPAWLRPMADASLAAAEAEAPKSRKRVAAFTPSPDHAGRTPDFVAPPLGPRLPGARPGVWDDVAPFFTDAP